MKLLATLLLASLPVPQAPTGAVENPQPAPHFAQPAKPASKKSGKWYFARSGHAVYCYGPVMTTAGPDGGLQRVATFCRGDQVMVVLKD